MIYGQRSMVTPLFIARLEQATLVLHLKQIWTRSERQMICYHILQDIKLAQNDLLTDEFCDEKFFFLKSQAWVPHMMFY